MSGNIERAARTLLLLAALLSPAAILCAPKLKITPAPLPAGTVGVAYSQALAATGGQTPYSWSVSTGALPAGLTLSGGGLVSGTPKSNGTFPFTAQVRDAATDTDTQALQIVVNNSTPAITTASLANGTSGSPYSENLTASGAVSPVSWNVSAGSLPAGLTLAASTGVISGTPSAQAAASFTVRLTDSGNGNTTKALSLTVNPAPLAITTTSVATGIVGTAYSQALGATGGTAPYTWSMAAGILPAGLGLLAAGTISGMPGAAGTSSFSVKVTDSASHSATTALSLTVNPAPLAITTTSVATGIVGTAYSQSLGATGGTAPYTWSMAAGVLPAGLGLLAAGAISGMPGVAGTSSFSVKVTDSAAQSATTALSLTIAPPVLRITTSSLPAGTVAIAYSQAIGAAGGSPPYSWSVASGSLPAGLSLSAGGTISGTPGAAGSSSFTLKVADSASQSTTAALSLTMNPVLSVTTTSLPAGTVGVPYSQALAPSGGAPPYTWSLASGSLPAGLSLSAGGTISGTPGAPGSSSFSVKVTDGASQSTTAALSLTINPVLSVTTTSLPAGTVGVAYSQLVGAAGGSPPVSWSVATGSLPAGLSLSTGGTISGTPGAAGTSNFTVKATDSAAVSATAALSLTINPPALKITTSSLPAGIVGTAYSQALGAAGGTPPYTWSVATGSLPAGLSLSAGGTISGTPGTAGTANFTVKVTDSASGSTTAALSLTINPPALSVTTSLLPVGTLGVAYSQALGAAGGTPPYSWSVAAGSLPAGLNLSGGGTISGTPGTAGTSSFTVKVTDSASGSATAALSLTINPPPVVITTLSLPAGTVGTAYSQALGASGGTPSYTWSVASGALPAGLNLSAGGTISGTPGAAGTSTFTVKVTDSVSGAATASLSLTISPPALSVTTSSLSAGTVGVAYSQALGASGGSPPYTWTVASGSLPAGLNLSAGGTISGTPGAAGTANFTVKATDSESASATAALSLTINPPALSVTTSSLPAGTVGVAYSQALGASGGTPPYSWTVASGSLPAGLNLSAGGTISGTPGAAGTSSFTVKATDSASASATAALSLTINSPALSVTTSSLPAGTVGTAYSQALGATGGSPPYTWSVASGSLPAGLNLSAGGTISGTTGAAGTSSFTVKATDSASASATAALSLTINPPALSVTTSSLPAGTVGVAYSQALGASGGSPPYSWTVASGSLPAGLNLSAGGTISGTPGAAGTANLTVKATDSASASATAVLSLTINPPALSVTTSALPAGTVGTAYSQALTASGGSSPYSWSLASGSLPAGLNLSAGGTISGTPGATGTASFTVKATDSASASATAALSLTINPPPLSVTTSLLPAGTVGVAYSQPLSASGGTSPYSWSLASGSLPAGLSLSTGGVISGTPGSAGSASFTVKATDSAAVSATAALSLTINPPPLGITTLSLPAGTVGAAYSQALAASGGSPPYSWSLVSGSLPAGLSLSAGGTISGTPGTAGSASFSVRARDSASGSATTSLLLTIDPPPLSITTSSLPAGTVGVAYSQALGASGGSPPYSWSVASGSLSAGLSLSAGGAISGTPGAAGSASFTLKATDSASVSATASLSLAINPPPLGITTSALPAGTVGTAYSQALGASGGSPPYSWSVASGSLPAGLSLSAGGTISGTPGTAGSASFTVKAMDSASLSATAPLSLTIDPPALSVTTSSLPAGTVGTAYSQALGAAGGSPPYTWSVASGSLPAGLSLSAGGTISGTPGSAGSASFTVKAMDSASVSATAALSLTINPPALGITTSSLPNGTAGAAYSQALGAAGGTPPYAWSVASGSLPAGLSLSASGTLSGTPGTAGASSFTVKATDSASVSATAALSLTINPPGLGITTSALPAGTVGTAYSQALAASGGTPPYSWSVASGALPGGLNLGADGTISGTPGTAGSGSFTVKVTDSASVSATAALSLTINPPALGITTSSLPAGTAGTAYTQALGASGGTPPYSWSVSNGSLPAGLSLSAGGAISGTPGTPGQTSFTVKVTDSASASTTASLSLTINPPGLGVTTSSLPAGTAGAAYSQALAASGGSPPYSWSVASGSLPAGLNLAPDGTISGTPGTAGSSSFTVKVTDSASVPATAALSLTVNPPALGITTSSLPAGTAGTAYSQALGASGGTPPYSWSVASGSLPAGLSLSGGGTISGMPGTPGQTSVTLKVTDSASASATASLSLTVNPPALGITTSSLPAGTAGAAYSQTLGASGGSPPYAWSLASGSLPGGLSLSAGGTISGTPATAGSSNFTVKVADSAAGSATMALSLMINPPGLGITTSSLPAGTVGTVYLQTLGASGGSPPYTWSLSAGGLPGGLNLSPTGTIGGTPSASGNFAFSVQVTDSAGIKTTDTLSIKVQAAPVQIMTSSLPASTVGATYTQPLTATGSPPFLWSLGSGSLPPGLTLDSGGAIRGTAKTPGSYTFSIQVADNAGASASMSYAVTINAAVSVDTASLADALIGAPYSQPLRAAGGTPPYTWSLTSGALPDGIKLDSGGRLSGTPTTVGSFTFTLRAVDTVSAFADRQFQITTAASLIITTAPILAPASAGQQYVQILDAAGGRAPYIWSISSGGLPAGITLNTTTGALGGSPSVAGSFQFTVDVSDSLARKASKQFSLMVAAPLGISSAPELPAATAGASYSQTLSATGGTIPYMWSITAGGLPAGLSFDAATAAISGVPTLGGGFTFTVQVTDNNSVTASKQFTLAVTSSLTITTASPLPDATAGSAYARSLSATGGVPPYVWTVTAGSLPAGLAIDPGTNSITGTPVVNGAFAFTLQVADAGGGSVSRDYTLAVSLPPLPSVSMDGLPDPANAADQPVFSISLAMPYPVQLTGQIVMSFASDAVVAIDDASVQFATGGRTVNFTIPAGSTTAIFSTSQMLLQTGTVAGAISLNLSVHSAGGEVTATAARTLHVLRGAPVTRTVLLVHTATGFELRITGYSTPRQLTQAVVQLTPSAGSNLQTTQLTIPLTDLAATWYQSTASRLYGSQFTLVLPFTIQGNAAGIDSVGVSLANDMGSSPTVSSKF